MQETKQASKYSCCADQRLRCDEDFSYEVSVIFDDKLSIDTNDYCTEGFTNLRCDNCGNEFDNVDWMEDSV